MRFYIVGGDGNQYGPADVTTLEVWAQEGRIEATTTVKNCDTGETMVASAVPGVFPNMAPPEPVGPPVIAPIPIQSTAPPYGSPAAYSQGYPGYARPHQLQVSRGDGLFWSVVMRSFLSVICAFFAPIVGVVFAGYAVFLAFRCRAFGNPKAPWAIGVSMLSLGLSVALLLLRGVGVR